MKMETRIVILEEIDVDLFEKNPSSQWNHTDQRPLPSSFFLLLYFSWITWIKTHPITQCLNYTSYITKHTVLFYLTHARYKTEKHRFIKSFPKTLHCTPRLLIVILLVPITFSLMSWNDIMMVLNQKDNVAPFQTTLQLWS